MATKIIESSKQRLSEKIDERKKYLESESYEINELIRLKKRKRKAHSPKNALQNAKTHLKLI